MSHLWYTLIIGKQGEELQTTQTNFDEEALGNVLLVEDNQHTREHLENSVTQHGTFQAHAVGTYKAAIKAIQTNTYDFFILDIGLPDGNGLELISPALKTNPDMLILVLTVFGQDEHVTYAIQAGAKGYLLKEQALENIHETLLSMTHGASPIDPRVARSLLQMVTNESALEKKHDFQLSDNEKMVLQYMSEGMMYKEIAYEMEVSINTVREYVRRIYRKMNVHSRAKAVQYANQI